MKGESGHLHIALISVHGLIRGQQLELGRDADTGGQILYVLELARALAKQPGVEQVDLITRRVVDDAVDLGYSQQHEKLADNAQIIRIDAGPQEYLSKEKLWDHLDAFVDNILSYYRDHGQSPNLLHSHYADAGYVGSRLENQLGVPLVHTGHSLGRVKRQRLMAGGLSADEVEARYNMRRRIEAEELTLSTAERVITSTSQEIEEQYALYDHYQPEQMCVIPPGTDLKRFFPPSGGELKSALYHDFVKYLSEPDKPLILALSRPDPRKNIVALVEAYGLTPKLQSMANLLIVAGNRDDIDELDEGAQEVFHELLVAIDRYDLYGKVAIPKHHDWDNVPEIYRLAAATGGVFVNPALTEPFGLTLLEAAASGLPLVATEDGGPRDILANCKNGQLVDPLDHESIGEALVALLSNKKRWRQFVKQGLTGVETHYSWDAHAQHYLSVIGPVVERSVVLDRKPMPRRSSLYSDRALVSDLDQNLLGDIQALEQFIDRLHHHRNVAKFILATGRRFDSALKLIRKHKIPEPDVLICSGGTEIYYSPTLSADVVWSRHIDYHWAPHKVKQLLRGLPGLKIQAKKEQSRFKLSYYIDPDMAPSFDEINALLHREELSVHLQFSFGQYLDVLPLRASKGTALRYVVERWQIPLERTFVAGGSGADEDMMRGNTLAVVVANRHHEELSSLDNVERVYFSEQSHAAGILEAMDYYDFYGRCSEPDESE